MTTLKQGDLVKNEDGINCKVLGVCGEVIHISYPYDHKIYEDTYTESFLKNQGYTWDTPAWEPAYDKTYWFVNASGQAEDDRWINDNFDRARRDVEDEEKARLAADWPDDAGEDDEVEEEEAEASFDESYINDSDPSVLRFLIASREEVSSKQVCALNGDGDVEKGWMIGWGFTRWC